MRDGLKVGNLKDGGLISWARRSSGGQRLIVVILDAKTAKDRAEEARRLFNWGFHGFDARTLFDGQRKGRGRARSMAAPPPRSPLVSDAPVRLMTPRGSPRKAERQDRLYRPADRAGRRRANRGAAEDFAGRMLALDVPLKTGDAVEQGPLTQRAKDAALELGLQLFHKGLSTAMHSLDQKPLRSRLGIRRLERPIFALRRLNSRPSRPST